MPNPTQPNSAPTDDKNKKQPPSSMIDLQGRAAKENEPTAEDRSADLEEEKLMAEIRTTAEAADKQALEAIQGSLKEAKRASFEPELPPDVEDAGVVNPTKQAEEVVAKGTTINLPLTEEEYQKGLKTQIHGKSDEKNSVFGVASIAALAIFIGRLFKLAHKHTMKVIFKKHAD
jgi:hypothetical protein